MRRWSAAVLGLWVLALSANMFAPCCEVIAATIPHDHVPAAHHDLGGAHKAPVQALRDMQPVPVDDHQHCASLDRGDSALVDNLVAHQTDYRVSVAAAPVNAFQSTEPLRRLAVPSAPAVANETGPPVYLATQRFRV